MMNLTQAERSHMHLALLRTLGLDRHTRPETPQEASRQAFAEAVALHADDAETPLDVILRAADAAGAEVYAQTKSEEAEFDMESLMEATGFIRKTAELVARLCGCMPAERDGELVFLTNQGARRVSFSPDFLADFA